MRLTPALALLSACALGFSACGDDDDEGGGGEAQVFEVQARDKGKETGISAPATAEPGATEIRFSNEGQRPHSLQIIQVGEGHTVDEALQAGAGWGEKGKPLPEWVRFLGGIGSTKPGGSGISVVDLPAGEYAAVDIDASGPAPYAGFTVEGDEGESLEEVPAAVEAVEYDFTADALQAGSHRVLFENSGEEPHHLIAAPLKPGKTVEDIEAFVKTEKGESPIVERKAFSTAILSGGESEVVDLRFESGDYALVCFVSDRAGGPPHALKGMVAAAAVE
jgi:hypothetical protein